jgi:pyruvate,orthophosphate dikinase
LKVIQPRLVEIAKSVMKEKGVDFPYKFGTMIEIPAAVTAAEIATIAEFFSFGTNDLTQMTYGYSRDDAERNFLLKYVEDGILPKNPFQTIDREGVGRLMEMCVDGGRKTRIDLEVGICGEHGGILIRSNSATSSARITSAVLLPHSDRSPVRCAFSSETPRIAIAEDK